MNIEELIIRSAHVELKENDRNRLERWRCISPGNEARYREVVDIARLARAAQPSVQSTPPTARSLIRAAIRLNWRDRTIIASRRRSVKNVLVGLSVAASILVMALLAPNRRAVDLAVLNSLESEYITGAGATRSVFLPDGSEILLGPSSVLRVSLAGVNPQLWLEGRAFFAIAKRDDRVVVVTTPAGRVAVLGTRFDVQTQADELKVVVLEGRVAVSSGIEEVEVRTGEMSLITSGTIELPVVLDDPLSEIEWMGQAMFFQTTLLVDAVREIEGRYGVEIHLLSPELGNRTVTASFDGQPFEEVMTIICGVVRAVCTLSDGSAEMDIL